MGQTLKGDKTMANIKFIRMYDFYNTAYVDILYGTNRLYTYPAEEMPKTAYKWLKDKVGTRQQRSGLMPLVAR